MTVWCECVSNFLEVRTIKPLLLKGMQIFLKGSTRLCVMNWFLI